MSAQGLTPKALANCSPGLERSDNPGIGASINVPTLKALHRSNAFSVPRLFFVNPGFSLRSNPGLKLANAFGVKVSDRVRRKISERLRRNN